MGIGEDCNFTWRNGLAYTEDNIPVRNVYLYQIPLDLTLGDIKEYMSQFGTILHCERKCLPDETHSELVYINFSEPTEASMVLKKVEHKLNKTYFYVNACHSWEQHKLDIIGKNDEILPNETPPTHKTIFDIDEYCQLTIFSFLELRDQIILSRTCTHFEYIFKAYSQNKYKSFNFDLFASMSLWEKRDLFLKAGEFIETLEGQIKHAYQYLIFDFVQQFCRNLEKINLCRTSLKGNNLKHILPPSSNITDIRLKCCDLDDGSILILKNCPQLKKLALPSNPQITGRHLELLENLEELSLVQCSNLQSKILSCSLKKLTKLRFLDIRGSELSDEVYESVVEHCQNLEALGITCERNSYNIVARLPKLKELSIFCLLPNNTRSEMFHQFIPHVKDRLEALKIISPNAVNVSQAEKIAELSTLKKLVIFDNKMLSDSCLLALSKLENLEELHIRLSLAVTNAGLIKLLHSCKNLRVLNIEGCVNVTEDFVFEAVSILKEGRHKFTPLRLLIFDTNIRPTIKYHIVLQTNPSLLKIIFDNSYALYNRETRIIDDSCLVQSCIHRSVYGLIMGVLGHDGFSESDDDDERF